MRTQEDKVLKSDWSLNVASDDLQPSRRIILGEPTQVMKSSSQFLLHLYRVDQLGLSSFQFHHYLRGKAYGICR